jgi:glycosyltransferase involved in cell wall biosynthesis/SAM-dependent methyltransferase
MGIPVAGECGAEHGLPLSVVVCTYNREELLKMTLDSLAGQTLGRDKFEIVVIDDGSSDGTRQCVASFADRLPIRYFFQRNAGLASAKNHGIFAARGDILFFMDDDDIAAPTLLEEHLRSHESYPEDRFAVLNYTTWAADLSVTPLMHFITEVGCFLFYYPYINHGDVLDYTYFWGGRSSCKRSFLIDHGVFNPVFRFGCEDIELGYRLSAHGLKVVYNSKAVSYMIRPIGFDDFCNRLRKQGRSQYVFSSLHDDAAVRQWAEIVGAEERWAKIKGFFEAKRNAAKALDKIADTRLRLKLGPDGATEKLLYDAYWWVFRACKVKGIAEAREAAAGGSRDDAGSSPKISSSEHPTAASPDEIPLEQTGEEPDLSAPSGGSASADHPVAEEITCDAADRAGDLGILTTGGAAIDLTRAFHYQKLVEEELEEYSNIEVTEGLREGGIHAQEAWEYWFRYLKKHVWKTSLEQEIMDACNGAGGSRILSLGCGYCGIELEIAQSLKSLNKQYEIVAVDINRSLFVRAEKEAQERGLNIHFAACDLNFAELKENAFDLILAHASLHHLVNLEHVFYQIHKGLKTTGHLILQDIIGKTQVLFWKENVDFARELVAQMPQKYKEGIADQENIIPPYNEPSIQKGMEGIRQEEIEEQVNKYFTALKSFKYGSFMRMICTHPELGKRFDPEKEEDRKYLEYLFRLDLEQVEQKKLRPTEMLAVYWKRKAGNINSVYSQTR